MNANGNQAIRISKNGAGRTGLMKFVRAIAVQGSDHDYEVRIAALEDLGECLVELENLLRLAMHDRDELVRTTALEIAGDASLTHLADEVVRRFTGDRSPLGRSAAAVALGGICTTNFRELLEESLETRTKK